MMGEYCIEKALDGSGRGLFYKYELITDWRDLDTDNYVKTLTETIGVPAEVRSSHLPTRSHKHDGCDFVLLGFKL
jgi:hypothetical protein